MRGNLQILNFTFFAIGITRTVGCKAILISANVGKF